MDFLRAIGLLTVLPVHPRWDERTVAGRAMAFYPLVGVLIGGALAGLAFLLSKTSLTETAPLLLAALILAAWAGITGGLHLDGWADCCDALFVPVSRERRLEILHDPRLGSFGGIGLAVLLLVKLAAIQGILASPAGLSVLVVVPTVARWALVIAARAFPLARSDGMAARFRQGLDAREVGVATVTAVLVAALATALVGWRGLAPLVVAPLTMLIKARLAVARLGGLTGDVYGAIVELAETAALVAVCLAQA
jgi:adenosylcobinamide-GDP ribazoletransferase